MAWMSNWQYANDEPTSPWRGALSIPRELGLRRLPQGLRVIQRPVRELHALREGTQATRVDATTALPVAADVSFEVAPSGAGPAGVRLFNDAGEEVVIGVGGTPAEVFVDRRKSRATAFHAEYAGRHGGPVVSDRVFPTQPFTHIEPVSAGQLAGPVAMWPLRSVWPSGPQSR
jgi:sucrose-6-phosphate hydrolase SacC (GH32 family)